jgi:hypothetical protein
VEQGVSVCYALASMAAAGWDCKFLQLAVLLPGPASGRCRCGVLGLGVVGRFGRAGDRQVAGGAQKQVDLFSSLSRMPPTQASRLPASPAGQPALPDAGPDTGSISILSAAELVDAACSKKSQRIVTCAPSMSTKVFWTSTVLFFLGLHCRLGKEGAGRRRVCMGRRVHLFPAGWLPAFPTPGLYSESILAPAAMQENSVALGPQHASAL